MDTFNSYDQRHHHHQNLDYGVDQNDSAIFDNIINSYEKADHELDEQSFATFQAEPKRHDVQISHHHGEQPEQTHDQMNIKRTIDYLKAGPSSPSAFVKQETMTDSPPPTAWMSGLPESEPEPQNFEQHYQTQERKVSADFDPEKELSNIIKKEPVDVTEFIQKRSKRGRKRKTNDPDVDVSKLDRISDDYRRKRERNNIAVRKSRDKAKMRQQERETQLMNLSQENTTLKDALKRMGKENEKMKNYLHSLPAHLIPSWIGPPTQSE